MPSKWASRIGERGEISPCSLPSGASLQFIQKAFSCAPDKRPQNIPHPEEVISGQQKLHTHTEGAFRHASAKDSNIYRDRGGGLYTFGVARATPTSKSATPMHASATPTLERTIYRSTMIRYQLAEENFWPKRHSIGLRGPCVGSSGPLSAWKGPLSA